MKDNEEVATVVADAESPVEKKRSKPSEAFIAFAEELKSIPEAENQLKNTLDFMEKSLSQENGVPHFKNFWEARDVCLKLFKETLSHQSREIFWARYSDLSREARRLKDMLDEQSAFAMEQIEIAIKAFEEEVATIEAQKQNLKPLSFAETARAIDGTLKLYSMAQAELNLLNAYAARINEMRKELIKTDMRVRHKNKFFQRLSTVGDHIFPRRKELIAQISDSFVKDIEAFCSTTFKEGDPREPSFVLRDEIKALQGMAKVLTLNTHAFTTTRASLSKAWDHVKDIAKERKAARMQYQEQIRQNTEEFKSKIDAVSAAFKEGGTTMEEASKAFEEINQEMRNVKLGRDEVKVLRDALKEARQPIYDKLDAEKKQREDQLKEQDRLQREKLEAFRGTILEFIQKADKMDAESIQKRREELKTEIQESEFRKGEKRDLELLFKPLVDLIQEKKEQALMNLSKDDQQSLAQLREVLSQRVERRQQIKNQLEIFRKDVGASGLDFEKAMAISEQINVEKERLDKINQGIEEIEEKIDELESKAR